MSTKTSQKAQKESNDADKTLLKELKHGPETPTNDNTNSTANNDNNSPNTWKASMKKWIKSCKVCINVLIQIHSRGIIHTRSL